MSTLAEFKGWIDACMRGEGKGREGKGKGEGKRKGKGKGKENSRRQEIEQGLG